jgi:hypothetical protein
MPAVLGSPGSSEATRPEIILYVPKVAGAVPQAKREPHRMKEMFLSRIAAGDATSFTGRLAECIDAMEKAVALECPHFSSPLKPMRIKEWGMASTSFVTHLIICQACQLMIISIHPSRAKLLTII